MSKYLILSTDFNGYEEKEKENLIIQERLISFNFKKFIIHGKQVFNFKVRYSNILGFIVDYNLRKPKEQDKFKYYCSGNFLIDEDKIIKIYDDNFYLIDAFKEMNILKKVMKGGLRENGLCNKF